MGKRVVSQASLKISKNHSEKTKKKQQLNSLIQVLRPKVYITDSSSFKTLVQELTGNGISSSSSSSPTPPTAHDPQPQAVIDHGGDPEISSSCMETFSDTSLDSFEPRSYYYNYPLSSCSAEEGLSNKYDTVYNQMFLEETTASVEYLLMNNHHHQQRAELLEYQELDSWLLDMEPADAAYSSCNIVSAHQIQQEVSIYDYELSGLI
ncbi:VQ motif containing protein [Melia azedarach]|uniref:VQ motif containing protein n=1 Tax=Melia azedarach TaxID=155640 RepID=A0ACC1YZ88_MELAZ|nr:VQ motif containing protein [Melia azedarach]